MLLSQLEEIITLQQEYVAKKERGIIRNIDFNKYINTSHHINYTKPPNEANSKSYW